MASFGKTATGFPSFNPLTTEKDIEEARRMLPEEKLLAGLRLFDEELAVLKEEIRREFPNADQKEAASILRHWLDEIHDRKGKEYGLSLGLVP